MTRRPPEGYVRIGRLGRSFKLSGGVRLHLDNTALLDPFDDDPDPAAAAPPEHRRLAALGRLFVPGLGDTRLRGHETVSGSTVIFLEGVRDRTAARALVNAEVWASLGDVPAALVDELTAPSQEDELIGLPVTLGGERIGAVTAAHLGGSNDYVEAALDGGTAVLLPLTAPYVTVSGSALALVDPPPGLLDG